VTAAGVRTTCPYCGVGCGVIARPDGTIVGDPAHPSNRGRLCSKGAALAATLDDSERLRVPQIGGRDASWDEALDLIARRFTETIAEHGPESVAFYVSGQCLTEDYYVANKLMKGFIGSGNIDTNSRLCMASSVAGHLRAFGEDVVAGNYEDFEQADLVVLVGSNLAWCHPVLHQRLAAARAARGTRVVVIDPRRTATAEVADLHLQLGAGTDVALFNGLLAHLDDAGVIDRVWVGAHAAGLEPALAAARAAAPSLEAIAAECGIDPEALEAFYEEFARTDRVLTAFSQGVNQSDDGTDKVNAIINCHLATARIGRPGMGPFSVTGQPNAMGGREVGGLANQLAAHIGFDDPAGREAVRRFWQAPNLAAQPGLKAVELFDAVLDGRVRALWIAATNPAVSMPRAGRVRAALAACPFVVVADCWPTDTTPFAHVLLPAAGWGEKDGTVTSSERRISRQRAFRLAPGEARPDWWMFAEVARRMGWAAHFTWNGAAAVFREHAALSGFANDGRRVFDIGALAGLDDHGYDALRPLCWPLPARALGEGGRLFAAGGFSTRDKRARFVPTPYRSPAVPRSGQLVLNTGRVRDQWHTMTRTGRVPALLTHTPEPRLAVHPADAAALGIVEGELVRIASAEGDVTLQAECSHAQRRGEAFAPMHWSNTHAAGGPVSRVVAGAVDPRSGQPGLKRTVVAVAAIPTRWHGLLLHRDGDALPAICHWVRIPVETGHIFRLAAPDELPRGAELDRLADMLVRVPTSAQRLEAADPARGTLRVAALVDGRLHACLFLARHAATLPIPSALVPLLGATITDGQRAGLLAARAGAELQDEQRVCVCFGVTRNAIRHAVVTHGLAHVGEIGAFLRAGTNCGSCIPELEEILRDVRIVAA
jgi:assimilatory nitrate reductase catalytic subunit